MIKLFEQHPDGYSVGQILRKHEHKGQVKLFTGVKLKLTTLQKLCLSLDPTGLNFPNIVQHSPTEGIFDDGAAEPDKDWGNIYGLLSELNYLKGKKLKNNERDEILRWIYTCQEALEENFSTFWIGWLPESSKVV